MMASATAAALKAATKGLLYQSETDSPFRAFVWQGGPGPLTRKKVLELGGHKPDTPMEQVRLEDFFADLTEAQEWHRKQEKTAAEKYRNLLKILREQLSGIKVFKVGATRLDVYIVGKTSAGDWAGVKTKAVET